MSPFHSDPALYILRVNGLFSGLSGGYVDDLIRTGDQTFKEVATKTHERFDMSEDDTIPCSFTGFALSRNDVGDILLDQHAYLGKLEELPLDSDFTAFRSMRMRLAWLQYTRPDCQLEIGQLAQVTEPLFTQNQTGLLARLNKAIRFAVTNRISLRIGRFNLKHLRVIGFSDSSFANNHDLSSQL